jgi:hypothetical protein
MLERIAIGVFGLWLTVEAILDGMHVLARWQFYRQYFEGQFPAATGPAITPRDFADLVISVLQLAIGLWLLLGSRGVANALARLRE